MSFDEDKKHSGLGIASFVISLLSMGLLVVTIAIAGYMEVTTPGGVDEESTAMIAVGLVIILGAGGCILALILGIAGLLQKNRKIIFAIIGLVLSALMILSTIGLFVLGSSA